MSVDSLPPGRLVLDEEAGISAVFSVVRASPKTGADMIVGCGWKCRK
jgi:hypothetical protein